MNIPSFFFFSFRKTDMREHKRGEITKNSFREERRNGKDTPRAKRKNLRSIVEDSKVRGHSIIYVTTIGNGMTNSFERETKYKMTILQIALSLRPNIYVRETKQRKRESKSKKEEAAT